MKFDRNTFYVVLGAFSVIVLGLLYWTYSSWSARSEKVEEYSMAKAQLQRVANTEPFPCPASITVEKKKADALRDWYNATRSEIAKGSDRVFDPKLSASAFKDRLIERAHKMQSMPGGRDGKLVASGFLFGLDDVVRLTPRAAGEIIQLQRQLDYISCLMELMVSNKVTEVTEIVCAKPKVEEVEQPQQRGRNRRNRNSNQKKDVSDEPLKLRYEVAFRATPEAFVSVMSHLTGDAPSKNLPFTVVEDFEINADWTITDDFIATRLESRKQALRSLSDGTLRTSRGPRRMTANDENARKAEIEALLANITFVDSKTDSIMKVRLVLDVYDFKTANNEVKKALPKKKKATTGKPKVKKGGKK